jgi:chromosomal replication initiator protein DnaA
LHACRSTLEDPRRDHTTVMYGCEKIAEELNSDARLRQEVATIRERLLHSAG